MENMAQLVILGENKMSILNKLEDGDYTIIIGCGRLGASLASILSENDNNVLIIDKDKDAFRKLSSSFGGLTLIGDGTDFDVLKEAQIDKASSFVALTDNDNINIMAAQIARCIYKIKNVTARLYNSDLEIIYKKFNINTICPSILSLKEFDKILSNK